MKYFYNLLLEMSPSALRQVRAAWALASFLLLVPQDG